MQPISWKMSSALAKLVIVSASGFAEAQCPLSFGGSVVPIELRPASVAMGDFNHDRRIDLAVCSLVHGEIFVLLGNGDSTFQSPSSYAVEALPGPLVAADFNGDGRSDLAVGHEIDAKITLLLSNDQSGFANPSSLDLDGTVRTIEAGDFNSDGRHDLAIGYAGSSRGLSIHLGMGNGTFGPPSQYLVGSEVLYLRASDFNGDGRTDLAVGTSEMISVMLSLSDGTMGVPVRLPQSTASGSFVVSDFNGDGRADIADSSGRIYRGNGRGSFQLPLTFTAGGGLIDAGDLDGDGIIDLVTLVGTYFYVHRGNGDGSFVFAGIFAAGAGGQGLKTADFNNDRRSDVVTTGNEGVRIGVVQASRPVSFGTQPSAQSAPIGGSVTFAVAASGTEPLSYSWRRNGVALVDIDGVHGANSPTLVIDHASSEDHLAVFDCMVSNRCGVQNSRAAALQVGEPCSVDFNSDGFIDFFDYNDFVLAFESGC